MPAITNISSYQFVRLNDLKPLRERLIVLCREQELKGTILLSTEGINLFVAGKRVQVDRLVEEIRTIPGLSTLQPKYSESDYQPFTRMLVKIKKEIIAFGVEGIDPVNRPSPKLSARELKQWLDEGRPVTLLDTRNDYEVKLGTFQNALPIGIDHFREFPDAVRRLPPAMKSEPIVMFCTGGIRCEKAGPFMEREGFQKIFQLDGGILKYFEECGGDHYQGECFVFDQRVGVDHSLHESENSQCLVCQTPLTVEEQRSPQYVEAKSCPYCFVTSSQQMARNIEQRQHAIWNVTNPLPGSFPEDNLRPLRVSAEHEGMPLLDFLCHILGHVSRESWEETLRDGRLLNGSKYPAKASQLVRAGERYFHKQLAVIEPPIDPNIRILYEDESILVVNKPAPLPVHPCGRFHRNTLQNILAKVYHPQNPRPAHRLDALTTGVLVAARTRHFASLLQPQFEHGEVEKVYLAKVTGQPAQDQFECHVPISENSEELGARKTDPDHGLPSHTLFTVVQRNSDGTAILEVRPLTGRTNQIRVHLWHLGWPIVGDPVYLKDHQLASEAFGVEDRLCLHAYRISFKHPRTRERITFQAEPPAWNT